jgi:hypothetical protein
MPPNTDEIAIGTESPTTADPEAVDVTPDVWAYADDGSRATTWAVERVDDTTARVEYHRHEAGLDDVHGPVEMFDIDPDTPTEDFALGLAEADPEEAVKIARRYHNYE